MEGDKSKKPPNKRELQLMKQKELFEAQQAEQQKLKEERKKAKLKEKEEADNILKLRSPSEIKEQEKLLRDSKISDQISEICRSIEDSAVPKGRKARPRQTLPPELDIDEQEEKERKKLEM